MTDLVAVAVAKAAALVEMMNDLGGQHPRRFPHRRIVFVLREKLRTLGHAVAVAEEGLRPRGAVFSESVPEEATRLRERDQASEVAFRLDAIQDVEPDLRGQDGRSAALCLASVCISNGTLA